MLCLFQQKKEHKTWESLTVLPLTRWLIDLWQHYSLGPERILSEYEEVLFVVKYYKTGKYYTLVQQAWKMLHSWKTSLATLQNFPETAEVTHFIIWSNQFIKICREQNWLSEAILPIRLITSLPHHLITWPKKIFYI